ncbi:hypothetical protein DIPPA_27364 [Diplonema papillatum]|nr:hypothetical protein DIPPA_23825 [Diplonema papillatum]KAJ9441610.1 hypothetical protein DIPPA_19692 [Diplonema papillatum]KAJ9458393.1 hypothetical protein DIPPA_27364 [Diplonema papillatum]
MRKREMSKSSQAIADREVAELHITLTTVLEKRMLAESEERRQGGVGAPRPVQTERQVEPELGSLAPQQAQIQPRTAPRRERSRCLSKSILRQNRRPVSGVSVQRRPAIASP